MVLGVTGQNGAPVLKIAPGPGTEHVMTLHPSMQDYPVRVTTMKMKSVGEITVVQMILNTLDVLE